MKTSTSTDQNKINNESVVRSFIISDLYMFRDSFIDSFIDDESYIDRKNN